MREEKSEQSKNRKLPSFGKICIVILAIILISIVLARYVTEADFRYEVDTKLFKKNVTSDNLSSIDLDAEYNPNVYAYSKYISVLSKGNLLIYNNKGKEEASIDVSISSAIVDTNGKYMVLGENSGSKIYMINNTNLVWQSEVEGKISSVNVNRNGYVSIIVTNTTSKSVIILFNPEGIEVLRYYVSSAYATCTGLSMDNKYLAIGEVDYSGTIVKSNVKIISIALAKSDSENSIINTYVSDAGEIITNLQYMDKENVIGMFTTYIQKINSIEDSRVIELDNNDIFFDINIPGKLIAIEKQASGNYSFDYQMRTIAISKTSEHLYILENSVPKNIICYGDKIGINYGTEVHLVNSSGWLLKKYTSDKEIKDLVLGENIAGIVYKDKIEIIKF